MLWGEQGALVFLEQGGGQALVGRIEVDKKRENNKLPTAKSTSYERTTESFV